jgi:hypothetical protein
LCMEGESYEEERHQGQHPSPSHTRSPFCPASMIVVEVVAH